MNARDHIDPREMTATTVGRDLLSALVTELKLLPQVWVKLSQSKQDDIIDRLRDRVDANIKMAVHLIASEGRTVVQGDLDQVTIKDGAKVVIKIGRGAESLHDLYDSQGKAVLIVVADSQPHTGGMGQVRGEADQRAMNLGKEYTDEDGDGMDDDSHIVDADFRELPAPPGPMGPTETELAKARNDGYDAAAGGEPESACPVMDGQLCIEWIKGWKQWHEDHGQAESDPDAEE
jgi:ribosome modulation factor